MAIGLGYIFGFSFPENFDHPYLAKSVTEFWRRWHMSLTGWFREYVYIPLGGNRGGEWKTLRNILIVWTLTGIWHGASWNFLLWGEYFAAWLILEKYVLGRALSRAPVVVQRVLASTTLGLRLWARLPERAREIAAPLLMLAGLTVCTAYLVDNSYNPFLYFRF